MGLSPLPLRYYPREQEDLMWWATESDGALGRKSIQGSIQARLEGSQGGYEEPDLITDPEAAFKMATGKAGFHAARRVRLIKKAYDSLQMDFQGVLAAVWLSKPHVGLEAFGHFANLTIASEIAKKIHKRVRSKLPLSEWLIHLSLKKMGVPDKKSQKRLAPTSTIEDNFSIVQISNDCERVAAMALQKFVENYRFADK